MGKGGRNWSITCNKAQSIQDGEQLEYTVRRGLALVNMGPYNLVHGEGAREVHMGGSPVLVNTGDGERSSLLYAGGEEGLVQILEVQP